jgi:hypothetical protein
VWTIFGWPYETSVAMTRLVFSGIFEKFPNLKVMSHHAGGMIPYFAKRIQISNDFNEMRLGYRYEEHLTKSPLEYFRMFYKDTAVYGNTSALMCTYDFCGQIICCSQPICPMTINWGDSSMKWSGRLKDSRAAERKSSKKMHGDLRLPA